MYKKCPTIYDAMKKTAKNFRNTETVVTEPGSPIHFPKVGRTNFRNTNPPTMLPTLREAFWTKLIC